jgi:ectoine hydroxylase-related dioxygenase (phytanoyl-CoA dioxygenase family)
MEYHRNEERGYHVTGREGHGQTTIIEDFWNAGPEFDLLLDHSATLAYIREIVQERPTINNSEIRIRYPGNATGTHMGGPISHKYRYAFTGGRIDCMMVRMIYFLHDVGPENGPFCVVPGTHKTNFPSPYPHDPTEEPGMIGLEVRAGDAILFTENLRHGGLPNRSPRARKTIHVGYGPPWMLSQNIATMDEPAYITPATRTRLTPAQNNLFRAWPQ